MAICDLLWKQMLKTSLLGTNLQYLLHKCRDKEFTVYFKVDISVRIVRVILIKDFPVDYYCGD